MRAEGETEAAATDQAEPAAEPAAEESADEPELEPGALKGTMLRWNSERGFGFIKPGDGGDDIFCHISNLVDGEDSVRDGDPVSYVLEFDDRAEQNRAVSVRYIGTEVRGAAERMNGTITNWNSEKGFGFIKPEGSPKNSKDLFCHISVLPKAIQETIKDGDVVTYVSEYDAGRKQHRAARVRLPGDEEEEKPRAKRQQQQREKREPRPKREEESMFGNIQKDDKMYIMGNDGNMTDTAPAWGGESPFAKLAALKGAAPAAEPAKEPEPV